MMALESVLQKTRTQTKHENDMGSMTVILTAKKCREVSVLHQTSRATSPKVKQENRLQKAVEVNSYLIYWNI